MKETARIRGAIVGVLERVPGIGRVHAFERYANDSAKLRALYASAPPNAQVRGWFVQRRSFTVRRLRPGRRDVTTTWEITGYQALADEAASELTFDALIDAIDDAFEADPRLGGAVQGHDAADPAGIQLENVTPVLFAGVLCHAANLKLVTVHTETDPACPCG